MTHLRDRGAKIFFISCGIFFIFSQSFASEVIEETNTKVVVREHPLTKRPYASIVSKGGAPVKKESSGFEKAYSRPDYRMLDSKIKAGQIPYEGPSNDRKKVYIFAGTLAALGTAGGAAVIAVAPAATAAAGASGGAGAYGVAGGAVAAGSLSAALHSTKSDPQKDNFRQISKAKVSQPILNKRDKGKVKK